jgi:uncharacterized membrane protein
VTGVPDKKTDRPEKKPVRRIAEKRNEGRDRHRQKDAEERARRARLDTPREVRRTLVRRPAVKQDAFGIFAEQFARFMGTARFLIYMTLFVVAWVGWNWLAPDDLRFDDYPFIFLTLMLSLQASYAAPLILLAQNRQEVRDRVINEQDRQANARAHADMEFLAREVASLRMALGEVATRDFLRSELRNLVDELGQDEEDDEGDEDPADSVSDG